MSFIHQHPASYRDPSGYIFRHEGILYRQVNKCFEEDFGFFRESGFYEHLVNSEMLIPHQEINQNFTGDANYYTTLQPTEITFISYPYEWSFDMLKDAALLTLKLALEALSYGMMVKDATPFNIQLHKGKMTFIDTLSFEKLDSTKPWIAYRQFCENFLAPLALMHYLKMPLHQLFLAYPEGIPLPVAQKMLPWKSKLHMGCYLHLHLHASYSGEGKEKETKSVTFSQTKLKNILSSLQSTINALHLHYKDVWSDYYTEAAQRSDYLETKKGIIATWIKKLDNVYTAIDLGANEGVFAQLTAAQGLYTIAADMDHFSINQLYKKVKGAQIQNLTPIILDIAHPSAAIGVNNKERKAFADRTTTDLVMALALIHHLAIGKNIPFQFIAQFMSGLGRYLIIEYVPKEDQKIQEMLRGKKDIYDWYTEANFSKAFMAFFAVVEVMDIAASGRKLYLMQRHEAISA